MKINYKNVNTNLLHDELIKNGIVPVLVESTPYYDKGDNNPIREDTWITFYDDVDINKVNEIIKAHDPNKTTMQMPTMQEQINAINQYLLSL